MRVREAVFDVLLEAQVDRIFGNPGSTELSLITGLPDSLEYVLCLHENVAVAAAAGYASLSGRPGFVNLHTLPGLANGSAAIATAASNRSPVVITAGQQDSRLLYTEPLLSGPLAEFAHPLVKWSHQPVRAEDVPSALERAFHVAMCPPCGPVFLAVPMDFMEASTARRTDWQEMRTGGRLADGDVGYLAEKLRGASAPAVVTGAEVECSVGWESLMAVVTAWNAPVYTAPLASKLGFPTSHPMYRGQLLPDARKIHDTFQLHDLVLVAGGPGLTLYPYSGHPLVPESTELVFLTNSDKDAARFEYGRSYVCDVPRALAAVAERCVVPRESADAVVAHGVSQHPAVKGDRHKTVEQSTVAEVCRQVNRVFGIDFVLVDESVSNGPVLRRNMAIGGPNRYLRSSNGGLGAALPSAIGAAMAAPDLPVVVVIGDGAFMYSPQALWTLAQLQLPVTIVVLNNARYQILVDFHRSSFAHLGPMVASDLRGIDVGSIARGFGVPHVQVRAASQVGPAMERAAEARGPIVLDVELLEASPNMFE